MSSSAGGRGDGLDGKNPTENNAAPSHKQRQRASQYQRKDVGRCVSITQELNDPVHRDVFVDGPAILLKCVMDANRAHAQRDHKKNQSRV